MILQLGAARRNNLARGLMSFRLQPPAPARLNRCQLFGPGSRTQLFEKMAGSAADVIRRAMIRLPG